MKPTGIETMHFFVYKDHHGKDDYTIICTCYTEFCKKMKPHILIYSNDKLVRRIETPRTNFLAATPTGFLTGGSATTESAIKTWDHKLLQPISPLTDQYVLHENTMYLLSGFYGHFTLFRLNPATMKSVVWTKFQSKFMHPRLYVWNDMLFIRAHSTEEMTAVCIESGVVLSSGLVWSQLETVDLPWKREEVWDSCVSLQGLSILVFQESVFYHYRRRDWEDALTGQLVWPNEEHTFQVVNDGEISWTRKNLWEEIYNVTTWEPSSLARYLESKSSSAHK